MSFLGELVKAHAHVEHHVGRKHVGVIDVAAIIRSIFEPLGDRRAADIAGLIVSRPVVTILRIETVIVLAKNGLLAADAVIDAG